MASKEESTVAWRNAIIEKEHELDGKSSTVNIKKCFATKLRVSKEVKEEVRARTINYLEDLVIKAEESAIQKGRGTIQLEDII